jgi:actin-related protein 3
MGYAGNSEPSYIIPTVIASAEEGKATGSASSNPTGIEDLNFLIGDDALNNKTYQIYYPVRHGLVDNWTHMEKFWQLSIFKYIRCEPEDHYFLLVSIFYTALLFFIS